MAIGGPFRELGGFLDACERGACDVRRVQVREGSERGGEAPVAADVELVLESRRSGEAAQSLCSPRIGTDGTVRFALESTRELIPVSEYDVEVELLSATVDGSDGGRVSLCVEPSDPDRDGAARSPSSVATDRPTEREFDRRTERQSGDTEASDDSVDEDSSGSEHGGDRELPPFKDPELLADVYDSCETFAEMADAIEMDVTAETVRRYMIDFDIHQPNSYRTDDSNDTETTASSAADVETVVRGTQPEPDTGMPAGENGASANDRTDRPHRPETETADDAGQDPVVLSDGLGLPDDVTAETLIETVKRSNTIYEVTQDIDLDRQDAFEMLHDLNLVDLVMGRLATEAEREITREEIVDRLRDASATQ